LISRGDVLRGRRGQPATPLFINHHAAYIIGCDVGWEHIEVVLVDLGGNTIASYRRDFRYLDADTVVPELLSAISDLEAKLDTRQRQRMIGIGIASPTNIARNIHRIEGSTASVPKWEKLDIRAEIEKATGHVTTWFNNGNCACWAELVLTPSPRPSSFAYLYVGTLLGGGLVAEHNLWQGPTGNSANLGGMLVHRPDGTREFGHLIASTYRLRQHLAEAGIEVPVTAPLDWPWDEWEPHVSTWIGECAHALAQIIHNTSAAVEINRVIVDGVMPRPLVERLVAETRRELAALPLMAFDVPEVMPGRLGREAVPRGAAFLHIFRKYFSRDSLDMLSWENAPVDA
jgi:predicted NBD/HSP70 family sugar kinase